MRHGSQPTANRPPHLVASYDTQGAAEDVFYPDVPTGRYHVKDLDTRNTHVHYESPITSGLKVMAKVKVFVHATDADSDGRAMTLAPEHIYPDSLKKI